MKRFQKSGEDPEFRKKTRYPSAKPQDSNIEINTDAFLPEDVEEEWNSSEQEKNPLLKFVLIGGAIALLAMGTAWIFGISQPESAENRPTVQTESPESKIEISPYLNSTSAAEVMKSSALTAQSFMDAASADERCEHILGGKSRLPQMLEFESRPNVRLPRGFEKVVRQIPNTIAGIPYWNLFATDKDGHLFEFVMIPTAEGMKIDWACSVKYGELSRQAFLMQKPEEPVRMRIVVSNDPLRNVDGILNYLIVLNGDPNAEFSAYFSYEKLGLKNIAALLRSTGGQQNLQVEMTWNAKLKMAEISKLNYIWWFDIEMIRQAAPELLADQDIPEGDEK